LVKPALFQIVRDMYPGVRVISCNYFSFLYQLYLACRCDSIIYTPSSHPIPFIDKQIIVLHDTYPFLSFRGSIKKILFVASARSSSCLLAYINHTDGLEFYKKHGFDSSRLMYSPNRFTGKITKYRSKRNLVENRLIIGLVGTESLKKNYSLIFKEIQRTGFYNSVLFLVFGHSNKYISDLKDEFSKLDISIFDSDLFDMSYFLASVDVIVSVAKTEGFGRPIASALESGVPCYLIENEIFREFFVGGAVFFPDINSLVFNLFDVWNSKKLVAVDFKPNPKFLVAFQDSINKISYF